MKVQPILRRVVAMEVAMWRSMYHWLRRTPPTAAPDDRAFSYLGVVKPILGVFIGLCAVEIPIFDLIIRKVSVDVRLRRAVTFALPNGPSAPADELRLYADDPDGLVRACRQVAGAEHASMRRAQES